MASATTLAAIDAFLKTVYPDGVPQNLALRGRKALTMMKKKDNFYGEDMKIPVRYGNPQGRSHTFSTAQSAVSAGSQIAWTLTRKANYGYLTIAAEALHASTKNFGAFMEAKKVELDGMMDELGASASRDLYGDGSGAIGRRASASTNVITLTNADDAKNFAVGMTVKADDTAAGSSPRTGSTTVTAVDRSNGTVTLASAAAISSFTDNDYLFVSGDENNSGKGFGAWLPLTAPTSGDSFYGVDRSVDPEALAGWRLDATSNSIEENILTLAEKIAGGSKGGGGAKHCYLNHANFSTLAKTLGTKVEYSGGGGTADVGFENVKVHTSAGVVTVYPDHDCPTNRGYIIDPETWTYHHMLGFPHLVEDDGLMALRQPSDDGVEIRCRYWGAPACVAPIRNGVFAI